MSVRDVRRVLPPDRSGRHLIATDLVDRAFSTWIIPLLGLIFLPFTTLIYAIAWVPGVHLGNGRWVWVAIAFTIELIGYAGTARTNRERMVRA